MRGMGLSHTLGQHRHPDRLGCNLREHAASQGDFRLVHHWNHTQVSLIEAELEHAILSASALDYR